LAGNDSLEPLGRLGSRTTWKYTSALGAAVFLLLVAFGALVVGALRAERVELVRADATTRGQQLAAAIESQFAHAVSAAHATAALVKSRAERAGTLPTHIDDFERFAENIVGPVRGVHALELAPDGVIRQVYPLAGNEQALGINLLADASQREDALKAIRERSPTIAGPLRLRQGGVGTVVRLAIFTNEGTARERFWGFAIVLVYVERLLDQAGIGYLAASDLHYRLIGPAASGTASSLIAASPGATLAQPVRVSVSLPNGEWMLELERRDGWIGHPILHYGAVALISLLLATGAAIITHLHLRTRQLALYDPLTGCATRTLFHDRLRQVLALSERRDRGDQRVALFYVDLDGFKYVNDTFGHTAGDEILRTVAQRFTDHLRDADTISRIGGDEFAIILPNLAGTAATEHLAQRLLELVAEPVLINRQPFQIGASLGISLYPDDARDPQQLLSLADHAMYRAKRAVTRKFAFAGEHPEPAAPPANTVAGARPALH
jgi:diguanylate cyclase (GGDEF)-like protein